MLNVKELRYINYLLVINFTSQKFAHKQILRFGYVSDRPAPSVWLFSGGCFPQSIGLVEELFEVKRSFGLLTLDRMDRLDKH